MIAENRMHQGDELEHWRSLKDLLDKRQAKVCVVGQGYVGLPLALASARAGFLTHGLDTDEDKVAGLISGRSHVQDIADGEIAEVLSSKKFHPTSDYAIVKEVDVVVVTVPTPLSKTKEPDVSYIVSALEGVRPHLHPGMLVVLESTTYPGTTEEIVAATVIREGLEPGKDIFVCFSPERTDPGNKHYRIDNTPKIIGGITPRCVEVGSAFYASFVERVVPVSSAHVAEMTKLLENTFRAVNIGLVNELALMCERMGIDIWEVIEAASTKPYGFMPFYPGPGIGGHCIPLDPMYLSWKARSFNFHTRFIDIASEINGNMPRHVISRIVHILNVGGKAVSASKVLLLGVAYKKETSDIRESPGLELLWLLHGEGADIDYSDPFVPRVEHNGLDLRSVELTPAILGRYDCVILATDHEAFDYEFIAANARVILDTRNAFRGIQSENIVRLGTAGPFPDRRGVAGAFLEALGGIDALNALGERVP